MEVRWHWARELWKRVRQMKWTGWLLLLWHRGILEGGKIQFLNTGLGRWRGSVKRPEGRGLSDPGSSH